MNQRHLFVLISFVFLFNTNVFGDDRQVKEDTLRLTNQEIVLPAVEEETERTISQRINDAFVPIVNGMGSVLFGIQYHLLECGIQMFMMRLAIQS